MGDELVMVVEANNAIEAIDDYCTTRIGKIVIGRKTGMFAIKLPSGRSMLKERF